MVTNLAYFYESARKVRGGKWVWVKDGNGESRKNVLLGGTIMNPKSGFDHLYAAQLVQYTPNEGCLIFRSFAIAENALANATSIKVAADGYSDAPEVGMYLMIAPDDIVVVTSEADTTDGSITTTEEEYTGTYAKVTAVAYDADNEVFTVTLANALGSALSAGDILVEGDAAEDAALQSPTGSCAVLVPNPNTFIEADRDLLPTNDYGFENANYSISTVLI